MRKNRCRFNLYFSYLVLQTLSKKGFVLCSLWACTYSFEICGHHTHRSQFTCNTKSVFINYIALGYKRFVRKINYYTRDYATRYNGIKQFRPSSWFSHLSNQFTFSSPIWTTLTLLYSGWLGLVLNVWVAHIWLLQLAIILFPR